MEKTHYMISDAANMVKVEAHVLRYWEDELGLSIPRNELGHRYYTLENIKEFRKIRELKEKGYQLKSIREIMCHDAEKEKSVFLLDPEEYKKPKDPPADAADRMEQFKELMSEIVGQAICRNNEDLGLLISRTVEERILKEMDYLVREQEEESKERYLKLDAAIRELVGKKSGYREKQSKREKNRQLREEKKEKRRIERMQRKNDRK